MTIKVTARHEKDNGDHLLNLAEIANLAIDVGELFNAGARRFEMLDGWIYTIEEGSS